MDNLTQFVEQLLKDKGTPPLDEAVHKQLVSDLSDRLAKLINRRLIEATPEDKLPELDKLFDEQPIDQIKIQQFLADNISDIVQVTSSAMQEFRQLYLGNSA